MLYFPSYYGQQFYQMIHHCVTWAAIFFSWSPVGIFLQFIFSASAITHSTIQFQKLLQHTLGFVKAAHHFWVLADVLIHYCYVIKYSPRCFKIAITFYFSLMFASANSWLILPASAGLAWVNVWSKLAQLRLCSLCPHLPLGPVGHLGYVYLNTLTMAQRSNPASSSQVCWSHVYLSHCSKPVSWDQNAGLMADNVEYGGTFLQSQSVLMMLRPVDLKFKANLNYIAGPCLKSTKQTNRQKLAKR